MTASAPSPPGTPGPPGNPSYTLVVYGAGDHGLIVAEAADAAGHRVLGFIDDRAPISKTVGPWPVLARSAIDSPDTRLIVAIGHNATRQRVCLGLLDRATPLASVIHPTAWVSPSATVGRGVYIGPHAVVNAQAHIEEGVILNTAVCVEHHSRIGAYAHLAPRATLAGRVNVGPLSLLGLGCTVLPGVRIGRACTVGTGAAVTRDTTDEQTVVGVPARPVRHTSKPSSA